MTSVHEFVDTGIATIKAQTELVMRRSDGAQKASATYKTQTGNWE